MRNFMEDNSKICVTIWANKPSSQCTKELWFLSYCHKIEYSSGEKIVAVTRHVGFQNDNQFVNASMFATEHFSAVDVIKPKLKQPK